jgi:hypothetical protein
VVVDVVVLHQAHHLLQEQDAEAEEAHRRDRVR